MSESTILAAYSSESFRREPVEFGLAASDVTGLPLVVVTVRHAGPMVSQMGGDVENLPGEQGRAVEHLRIDLKRRRVNADVRVVDSRTTAGGLQKALEEIEPELVVLGAPRPRGKVRAALMGTTVERVIGEAKCPVAIVPDGYARPDGGVRTIGVAFAPTAEGREALQAAAALARAGSARLRAVTVIGAKHEDEEEQLRSAVSELGADVGVDVDVQVHDDPAEALVAVSGTVDLLVMGTRARGPRRAVVLGSVSREVAERSHCPVIVLSQGATETSRVLLARTAAHSAEA
jgi:nucleotide-binding universal stress UspA family protein